MFDVPSDYTIERVIIDADCIHGKGAPQLVRNPEKKPVHMKVQGKRTLRKKASA